MIIDIRKVLEPVRVPVLEHYIITEITGFKLYDEEGMDSYGKVSRESGLLAGVF
ncbi:MAG: hypothetical protein ACE14V_02515 [bacterium]